MRLLSRTNLKLLLKLTAALGSLCIFFLLIHLNDDENFPTYIFGYNGLKYTDDDGGPENACNCTAILQGDQAALEQAKLLTISKDFKNRIHLPDEYYINATQDCRSFKLNRKYITFPLSKEEEDFPLAYSMVVHHKVQNFERLLRAIYAPQNIYCVHVDKKSQASVSLAIQAIISCFPNVFLVSKPVSVVYAAWPRVQADLNCMADLYNSSTKWKYFINLCGQDFPLKTNLEMIKILQGLRGSNSMESEALPESKKWRISYVHEIINGNIKTTEKVKDPPPFNLPIMSGNAYIIVSRGYIHSVLKDSRIQSLIEWFNDTYSPDEHIWATIQRIPDVPGSQWPNRKYDMTDMNAFARLVKWEGHEGSQDSMNAVYPVCHGNHVRGICVYGTGDLPWLIEQHHFFSNKFDVDIDPIAVYCLEKYLRKKAIDALK